ncbi:MAG: hypothetical protein IGS48_18155 [Oscillatoriales cyanobacterium C42_A2020_001]|nr:hypothetical protein [Leptolyngbyaceae cyanobacterium C42_A2020_001]
MGSIDAFLPVNDTSVYFDDFGWNRPSAQHLSTQFDSHPELGILPRSSSSWLYAGASNEEAIRQESNFGDRTAGLQDDTDSFAPNLEDGIAATEAWLTTFANSDRFQAGVRLAFGDASASDKAEDLFAQWSRGIFDDLPSIEILTAEQLNGARGAFSQTTNTIYLSQTYLEQYASDTLAVANVLLEELGHFVDATINDLDAPGDEGAIFAAIVQGVYLSDTTLQLLKSKDDSTTLILDGDAIVVEQATTDTGNGLRGEYYDNSDLTNLKLTRTDGTVNFSWGTGSPHSAIAANTFSTRWTGQVQPSTSGTYTFFTQSDDGVRLWVNGTQLINNWTTGGYRERSGSIPLIAGQKYDIKLEYYENTNSATARLLWSGPSVSKQAIAQTQLFSAPLETIGPTASATANNVSTGGNTIY